MIMANRHRGEIDAKFDGREYTLCLTLGALAELEEAFGADDLLELTERFQGGRFKSRDLTRIIGAGLRGGGHNLTDEDVSDLRPEGGLTGLARMVTLLLSITFGSNEDGNRGHSPNMSDGQPSNPI
ncbi:MAG: gene transfer agent family protein [Hyphomicrobiales bacterium]